LRASLVRRRLTVRFGDAARGVSGPHRGCASLSRSLCSSARAEGCRWAPHLPPPRVVSQLASACQTASDHLGAHYCFDLADRARLMIELATRESDGMSPGSGAADDRVRRTASIRCRYGPRHRLCRSRKWRGGGPGKATARHLLCCERGIGPRATGVVTGMSAALPLR